MGTEAEKPLRIYTEHEVETPAKNASMMQRTLEKGRAPSTANGCPEDEANQRML